MPIASPTMTSYGVAKAAQDTLTKNLAFEFATKGVRVNSVLPGVPNQWPRTPHNLNCLYIQTNVMEGSDCRQGTTLRI